MNNTLSKKNKKKLYQWGATIICVVVLQAVFYFSYTYFKKNRLQRYANDVSEKIQSVDKDFKHVIQTVKFQEIDFRTVNNSSFSELLQYPFFVQVFKNNKLVFWTSNRIDAQYKSEYKTILSYLYKFSNGWYYIRDTTLGSNTTVSLILPIRTEFFIKNKYLKDRNNSFLDLPRNITVSDNKSINNVVRENKETVFYLDNLNYTVYTPEDWGEVTFWGITFLVQFFCIHHIALILSGIRRRYGVLFLVSTSLFMRYLYLVQKFPNVFQRFDMWDPKFYASSALNPSIADLLMNTVWVFWITYFIFKYVHIVKFKKYKPSLLFVLFSLLGIIVIISSYLIYYYFEGLIFNSVISFDIIHFTKLSYFSFLGLCGTYILTSIVFLWIRKLAQFFPQQLLMQSNTYLIEIGLLILYSVVIYITESNKMLILMALITIVAFWAIKWKRKQWKWRSLFLIIIQLVYASLVTTILILHFNYNKEQKFIRLKAESLANDKDFQTEFNFSEVTKKIESKFKESSNSLKNTYSEYLTTIQAEVFATYAKKYKTEVFLYDKNGVLISEGNKKTLSVVRKELSKAKPTLNKNLFHIRNFDKSYYCAIVSFSKTQIPFTACIYLFPKTDDQSFYPELFSAEDTRGFSDNDYNYAVYTNGVLSEQKGAYAYNIHWKNFVDKTQNPFYNVLLGTEYAHFWFEYDENKEVVISRENYDMTSPIVLFSYIFCFYTIYLAVVRFSFFLYKLLDNRRYKINLFLTFRSRINLMILVTVGFCFIVIGWITYTYFSSKYETYHRVFLINKHRQITQAVQTYIDNQNEILNSTFSIQKSKLEVMDLIKKLSVIHGIDVNIYDIEGHLLTTSQTSIFEKGLLSDLINPKALVVGLGRNNSQFVTDERTGSLDYISVSSAIRDNNMNIIGFISIPYLSKSKNLENDISSFVVTLINVYIILFIIALLIAFSVSNSITSPLGQVASQITAANFQQKDKRIKYNRRDELGELVYKYNQAIEALEKSAKLLAQSEREYAWREMAKQIAHEIKNPLTPMKLSIQYLQKMLREDKPGVNKMADKVAASIIEQIENLSQIATEFSHFAKMPKPENEVIRLNDLIIGVIEIFKKEPDTHIVIDISEEDFLVYGDRNQLISVFNNLIKNAIQAKQEALDANIIVAIRSFEQEIKVLVKDNGVGITEENKNKIFQPNFTTKNSGTGLGLAICKKMIEGMQGKIWFESTENLGTTFFVSLPKYTEENI